MDIETSLKALTLSNAGIAAVIGQRYYIDHIPDGVTYPIVKAQTITDNPIDIHSSNLGGRALIQLDVYDDDKQTCSTSADLIRVWLHNYRGAFGGGNATIKIRNVQGNWDVDSRLFRKMLEAEILYLV